MRAPQCQLEVELARETKLDREELAGTSDVEDGRTNPQSVGMRPWHSHTLLIHVGLNIYDEGR